MSTTKASLSRSKASEILAAAAQLQVECPSLRLGQAIVNVSDDIPAPWPEFFHEEDPVKVMEMFYELVENGGKRLPSSGGLFGSGDYRALGEL